MQRFVYCPQLGPCDVAIDAYTTNVDTMPRERVGYDLGLVRSIIRVPQSTPMQRWTHVNKMCVIFLYLIFDDFFSPKFRFWKIYTSDHVFGDFYAIFRR